MKKRAHLPLTEEDVNLFDEDVLSFNTANLFLE